MTSWNELQQGLGARCDARGWLHVEIAGRRFTLMSAPLGRRQVIVAHSHVVAEDGLFVREAAIAAAGWPIGGLVLLDGQWVIRHAFPAAPPVEVVEDALRFLAFAVRDLLDRPAATGVVECLAHYAH